MKVKEIGVVLTDLPTTPPIEGDPKEGDWYARLELLGVEFVNYYPNAFELLNDCELYLSEKVAKQIKGASALAARSTAVKRAKGHDSEHYRRIAKIRWDKKKKEEKV